jgi:hypothetical protein
MAIPTWMRWPGWLVLPAVFVLIGCMDAGDPEPRRTAKDGTAPKQTPANKVNLSQNIWMENQAGTRRVLVSAEVCLRAGPLEQLLTRKGQKEHEAILTADIDARKLHEALLLAGAEPGSPAQFVPRYRPASGTTIRVSLIYDDKGTKKTVPARSWIRGLKSKAELECDWVFAGSMLVDNPFDPAAPKRYLANDGDVICISNFESALLDLPIFSSKGDEDRGYEAWTERIPPEGTKVVVVLEPVLTKKK